MIQMYLKVENILMTFTFNCKFLQNYIYLHVSKPNVCPAEPFFIVTKISGSKLSCLVFNGIVVKIER